MQSFCPRFAGALVCILHTISFFVPDYGCHFAGKQHIHTIIPGLSTCGNAQLPWIKRAGGTRPQRMGKTLCQFGLRLPQFIPFHNAKIGYLTALPVIQLLFQHFPARLFYSHHEGTSALQRNTKFSTKSSSLCVSLNGQPAFQGPRSIVIACIQHSGVRFCNPLAEIIFRLKKHTGYLIPAHFPGNKTSKISASDNADFIPLTHRSDAGAHGLDRRPHNHPFLPAFFETAGF